jgi:hypothetical protein
MDMVTTSKKSQFIIDPTIEITYEPHFMDYSYTKLIEVKFYKT